MITDEQIIQIAKDTKTAEPGRDGYILPISFARKIIALAQQVKPLELKQGSSFMKHAQIVLQDVEQYRLQMAAISAAAIGYWKEADGIHPDYDTVALRDVAQLYVKYEKLHQAKQAQAVPPAIDDETKRIEQPLTDQEICGIALPFVNSYSEGAYGIHEDRVEAFARAIERAHGIVNE